MKSCLFLRNMLPGGHAIHIFLDGDDEIAAIIPTRSGLTRLGEVHV